MSSLNSVMLIGNLTRAVDLRYTPKGDAVADLGLAVNETYKTKQGEKKEDVVFVDITVWGKTAENCAQYLDKGSPILVIGRLSLDVWEKDGEKRSRLKVKGDRIQFLGSKPKRESQEDEDEDTIPFK